LPCPGYKRANAVIRKRKSAIEELNLKTELERISEFVSMAYIAGKIFGKSRQWLNNRIKGNWVNGIPATFTDNELNHFFVRTESARRRNERYGASHFSLSIYSGLTTTPGTIHFIEKSFNLCLKDTATILHFQWQRG
jgi:hypothetical protein